MPASAPLPDHALAAHFLLPAGTRYLDCAAHGPRLRVAHAALLRATRRAVPPQPVSAEFAEREVQRLRQLAAGLFDGDADAIALVPSAAFGLSTAAANLPLHAGERVLVLEGQFPSHMLCWQQRCAARGARLETVRPGAEDGTDAVLDAIERTPALRIAALQQVDWRDGRALDLDRITAALQARGIALVLDLSQSAGALPVDIARWQPAFAVTVGHKWALGAYGLAYLWCAPPWRAQGGSLDGSWLAREARSTWRFDAAIPSTYRPGARRYDGGGVLDQARVAMSTAGLEQLHAWGIASIADALTRRVARLGDRLREASDCDIATPVAHILGVRPRHRSADAVRDALAAAGIACTARHGVLRLAPHLHLGLEDMDAVADAIACADCPD